MKITKLEKKKRLYLLELDHKETCYITEDTIVKFFLSKDKEVDEKTFQQIKSFAQLSYGKNLALYYLSFKKRTKKEATQYLEKYDIESTTIQKIINELEQEKWIDDYDYAQTYIQQNLTSGDKGPMVLQQKLAQKGISKHILNPLISETDFSEQIQKVAEKILRKYQGKLPTKALQDKITQQLINKGFTYQSIKTILPNLAFEKDEETELELLHKELDKQHRKYARKYEGYELKQRLTQSLARRGYDYDSIKSALRDYL
ncbi:recombination regulator RecX [Streptococcus cameli]